MQVAIFQVDGAPMGVVFFSPDADVELMAPASVPAGIPYWLVQKSEIDALHAEQGQFRDAWELDSSAIGREPDGVGEA